MRELKGAFTALITPMKDNGDVDYDGFKKLINFQLEAGIDGIVPIGTTGEAPTLSEAEEEALIRIAVDEAGGKVPVIIGTGSNNTKCMLKYTQAAKDLGADIAMVVTPYYNKPNDDGLVRHFEAAAAVGIPILVQHRLQNRAEYPHGAYGKDRRNSRHHRRKRGFRRHWADGGGAAGNIVPAPDGGQSLLGAFRGR